jgi:pantoate--beta-alanine ligase
MTVVAHTRSELDDALRGSGPRAVVMTMGALHEGHVQLMRRARDEVGPAGTVVVTDFVNPTQFGAGEDFDRYPRTLDADVELCRSAGVDVVFAPSVEEVYADPASGISVDPGPRGSILEGASRPGHFSGVLTVVATLLNLTRADVALFGEKDYQQLVLIRTMANSLAFPVRIVGVPTVRESDGLAMSSRNRYLSEDARQLAAAIPRALDLGRAAAASGADAAGVAEAARTALDAPGVDIDYVVITDTELRGAPTSGEGRLLVAVVIDGTRLLDNASVQLGSP